MRSAALAALVLLAVLAALATRRRRETYGPPPWARRATSHFELGHRGWPEQPREYEANTASAISHYIMRSA